MFRRAYGILAYLVGVSGAAVYFAFILGMGVGVWPRSECSSALTSVGVNLGLLAMFALQHSGMARIAFKRCFQRLFPETIERSTYVLASGLTLGGLTLCWQPLPGEPIWQGPIVIAGIGLAGGAAAGLCAAWYDHAAFFGLAQSWTGVSIATGPLRIGGPYRYVRHPLMLGLLIAIWGVPIMPPELLMLNLGMTAYVIGAIHLEERDLLRVYGSAYEQYQRETPMLFPWPRRTID